MNVCHFGPLLVRIRTGRETQQLAVLKEPLDSSAGEFCGSLDLQLAFDVFAMCVDGVCTEEKLVGNNAGG